MNCCKIKEWTEERGRGGASQCDGSARTQLNNNNNNNNNNINIWLVPLFLILLHFLTHDDL